MRWGLPLNSCAVNESDPVDKLQSGGNFITDLLRVWSFIDGYQVPF